MLTLLVGCAFPHPAAWSGCPFDQQIVVNHDFRCGTSSIQPKTGQKP